MKRVEVTKFFVGITTMQVCAESDVTDEEILEVRNIENPSETTGGWSFVIRKKDKSWPKQCAPVPCRDHEGRIHFLVSC
jgi:hypothetical protein